MSDFYGFNTVGTRTIYVLGFSIQEWSSFVSKPRCDINSNKSRLDLHDICYRNELYIKSNWKILVSVFQLSSEAKSMLFNWMASEVKFSDGYISNLSRYVENKVKVLGIKSHDCHAFMKWLLLFAFGELLSTNVHEAIAGKYCLLITLFSYFSNI